MFECGNLESLKYENKEVQIERSFWQHISEFMVANLCVFRGRGKRAQKPEKEGEREDKWGKEGNCFEM